MLVTVLALALTLQDPGGTVDGGGVPPDSRTVTGTVELSAGEAYGAALAQAEAVVRAGIESRVKSLAARHAPAWLPGFVLARERVRWLRALDPAQTVEVLDRRTEVRDHGYAKSYQVSLLVRAHDSLLRDARRRFSAGRLRRVGEDLVVRSGGIVLFWGALAFLFSWFDRLSRGYMTWRLRLIAMGLAVSVPLLVFLF